MGNPDTTVLQVAAKAVIVNEREEVLIVREAATGKNNTKVGLWGLIGGRLEPGEAFAAGLAREVLEEVGLEVEALQPVYVGEWRPVIHTVPHQIIAIFVRCKPLTTNVRLSEEHDAYKWIEPASRHQYKMMEPDCYVVDALVSKKW